MEISDAQSNCASYAVSSMCASIEAMAKHRPGDIILDQYLPNASTEQREEARENLRRLARLLIRVHQRRARDNPQHATRPIADAEIESELLPPSI